MPCASRASRAASIRASSAIDRIQPMAIFTLTINERTAKAGETDVQERLFVVELLRRAAQQIANGSKPQSGQHVAEPGAVNPTNCSYEFGPGSINKDL